MHDLIVLGLPVIWTVVAVIVALLLYKSSSGWLEGKQLFGLPVNSLRLGGSVVIFFVAFLLLKNATPTENLVVDRRDRAVIDRATLQAMDERSRRMEDTMVRLRACVASGNDSGACAVTFEAFRRDTEQLRRDFETLRGVPEARP